MYCIACGYGSDVCDLSKVKACPQCGVKETSRFVDREKKGEKVVMTLKERHNFANRPAPSVKFKELKKRPKRTRSGGIE